MALSASAQGQDFQEGYIGYLLQRLIIPPLFLVGLQKLHFLGVAPWLGD